MGAESVRKSAGGLVEKVGAGEYRVGCGRVFLDEDDILQDVASAELNDEALAKAVVETIYELARSRRLPDRRRRSALRENRHSPRSSCCTGAGGLPPRCHWSQASSSFFESRRSDGLVAGRSRNLKASPWPTIRASMH